MAAAVADQPASSCCTRGRGHQGGWCAAQVQADTKRVRRLAPLPEVDTADIERRTVLVEHLPATPTIGEEQAGGVEPVSFAGSPADFFSRQMSLSCVASCTLG